ncbi:MAG TPA: hypothetical protein VMI94_28560 [Bryobacteraceae bacterium]|nr:hypothetical protein [Bryobacteraceae bacterium]
MLRYLKQAKSAIAMLSPEEVRARAERPLIVGLVAEGSPAYADIEDFLMPSAVTHDKRMQVMQSVYRASDAGIPSKYDLVLYQQGLPCPSTAFTFFQDDPERTVNEILTAREDLWLVLARSFHPFRKPVVDRVVNTVARENAVFAVASALPNVIPNLLELPWALGEFASDTAFITMNQVRMAFLVAAASDKKVGYSEQLAELVSIAAGAFGWRALARELVGFIPLGGGLIPKGAIAYAATYVLGKGLEHYHGVGYGYTRSQRRAVYQVAYDRGKELVDAVLRKHEATS